MTIMISYVVGAKPCKYWIVETKPCILNKTSGHCINHSAIELGCKMTPWQFISREKWFVRLDLVWGTRTLRGTHITWEHANSWAPMSLALVNHVPSTKNATHKTHGNFFHLLKSDLE
jgi:hypothetical protein